MLRRFNRHRRTSAPARATPPPDSLTSAIFGALSHEDVACGDTVFHLYGREWNHPNRGVLQIVFYPPSTDPALWQSALRAADLRAQRLLDGDLDALAAAHRRLASLMKNYRLHCADPRAIIPDLRLTHVKLNAKDNDELIYAPCKWFSNFDLNVEVDRRQRVKHVWFDG